MVIILKKTIKKEKGKRKILTVIITVLIIIIALSIVSFLRFTGYAILDTIDVFSGKEIYSLGETVHLFVLPTNATHIIEVLDSNGNLYADSLNFPAEKIGTFSVKATLIFEGEVKEVYSSFEVVDFVSDGNMNQTSDPTINQTANNQTSDGTGTTPESANQSLANLTGNTITPPLNFTGNDSIINFTITKLDENASVENVTLPPAVLHVYLDYPPRINRGESAEISARITNSGGIAENVRTNWEIPEGFELVSGGVFKDCGNMTITESCSPTISVRTSSATSLGAEEVKIRVSYGG